MADFPIGEDEEHLARRVGDAATVRQVFDALPLLVVAMDGPQLRVVATTAAYREYVGRQEMIGAPISELFVEAIGQHVMEIHERVYATGQSQALREFRIQFQHPRDGLVEMFVDYVDYPWFDPDGSVRGVIVSAVDVTEQVRARRIARAQSSEAQQRYERARDIIDALQRELLPAGLPVLPTLEVAASYLLADADTGAGGDWFDAFTVADGRVALVVGDVVGHGVAASATMGQLRVLLHERLIAEGEIPAALSALDLAASRIRGARAATVSVVLLDTISGEFSYCTAGHPPPLLLDTAGGSGYLPTTGGGPLGVGSAFTEAVVGTGRLDPGEMVLLYTDGILERPGRQLAQASVELAQAAADVAADRAFHDDELTVAERVCTQTLELLTRVTGHRDDITLLAGQRLDPMPPFELEAAADPQQLAMVRVQLAGWLDAARIGPGHVEAVEHAVIELATNCVEHAYTGAAEGQTFVVTARLAEDGRLRVQVRDRGVWREPRPSPERGLGLQLAAALADDLHIEHGEHGTTATLTLTPARPARLLTVEQLAAGQPALRYAPADPLLVFEQPWAPEPRIRIDGPVDAATADQVEHGVREAGAAGTRNLTVDLTGVSHLASAGVAVLHRQSAAHEANGTALRLYAPTASPADVILTLVELEHMTQDPHTPRSGAGDPGPGGAEQPGG